jgi:predicted membrane channel-forming protein YqfA (hemolysin III family)
MTIVGVLGTATMVLVMWEKFSQPEYRTLRAIVFVSLGLLSALPTIHFIVQVKHLFIIPLRCLRPA